MSIELKSALDRLEQELKNRLNDFERHPPKFGNPELMRQAVEVIRNHVDGVSPVIPCDLIQKALTILYKEGLDTALSSHRRYLCWGLLAEWGASKKTVTP